MKEDPTNNLEIPAEEIFQLLGSLYYQNQKLARQVVTLQEQLAKLQAHQLKEVKK